jgi:hypothetical protein
LHIAEKGVNDSTVMARDKPRRLLQLARDICSKSPRFQDVLGPGDGNRATAGFLRQLQQHARKVFGEDFSEKRVCGDTSQAVDFYFPDEATIVEVALGLPNPASEFEKDVLKAIMARECGHRVACLFFISRAGADKKCNQPGRAAIKKWAFENHGITIVVHELAGTPRRRLRHRSR